MIHEQIDYKKYLNKYITALPQRGRGFRLKIADQLNCKASFVSQVLSGPLDFSLEQAIALNPLLHHGEREGHYFLLLVQYARAGSSDLRQYFRSEIDKEREKALRLKNRIQARAGLSPADEVKYFSSAEYALVHILTTIGEFQSKAGLLGKSGLSVGRLEEILADLLRMGYVKYRNGKYLPGPTILHLPDDSSMISLHHTNWRVAAIKSFQTPAPKDIHYSSVITISRKDFLRIKTLLVKAIEEAREIINRSDCEVPVSFCLDLFEIQPGR